MNIVTRWAVVVTLNAVVGFALGYEHGILGMVFGVFTWFFIYLGFDLFLQKRGYVKASKRLFLCAVLRIFVQFIVFVDMYAGFFAIVTVEFFGVNNPTHGFIFSYLTTFFTGLYLSVICSFLYFLLSIIDDIKKTRKHI